MSKNFLFKQIISYPKTCAWSTLRHSSVFVCVVNPELNLQWHGADGSAHTHAHTHEIIDTGVVDRRAQRRGTVNNYLHGKLLFTWEINIEQ